MRHQRPLMPLAGLLLATSVLAIGLAGAEVPDDAAAAVTIGERIYREGVLGDGTPLLGTRSDGLVVRGAQAACGSCHRPSGLGSVEGNTWVPPITGRALFGGAGHEVVVRTSRKYNAAHSLPSTPRSDEEIGNLVISGQHRTGRILGPLMPRYPLSARDTAALLAYLHELGRSPAPGVTPEVIHLATVITPEVSPSRRDALVRTLQTYAQARNVSLFAGKRKRVPRAERLTQSRRRWQVHVWELQGHPENWSAQLHELQQLQPVFALLSGTGSTTWQPVSRFCATDRVVCWFPSIDMTPTIDATDRYGLYFSAGSTLDAEVIAETLQETSLQSIAILHDGSAAAVQGSRELVSRLPRRLRHRLLDVRMPDAGRVPLTRPGEGLVIFGTEGIKGLLSRHPAPGQDVWWAAGAPRQVRDGLPEGWRKVITLVDRFEQGPLYAANLQRFHDWAEVVQLPIVDERLQAEAYFAASFLASTLTDVLNNLQPDYLVERAQDTLSMRESEGLQMQVQALMMGGGGGRRIAAGLQPESAEVVERRAAHLELQRRRTSTTLYPRLSLGSGQHFAAKGAFLVSPDGVARWIVPGHPAALLSSPASVADNRAESPSMPNQGVKP